MKAVSTTVLIIAGIFIAAAMGLTGNIPSFSTIGLTTVSADYITIETDSDLGESFALHFFASGMSQWVKGVATTPMYPSADGRTADDLFKMDILSVKETCKYDIGHDVNAPPVMRLTYQEYTCDWWGLSCPDQSAIAQNQCKDLNGLYAIKDFWSGHVYCVYPLSTFERGIISEIGEPDVATEVSITVGDNTETKTLSKDQSVALYGDFAKVKYLGNIDYGDECPNPIVKAVMPLWYNGGWQFVDPSAYEEYRTKAYIRFDQSYVDNIQWNKAAVDGLINDWNVWASQATRAKPFTSDGGVSAVTSGQLSKGIATLEPNNLIRIPQFIAYMKATEVVIVQPEPRPSIPFNGVGECFLPSGNTERSVPITVKNTGTGRGEAEVSILCDSHVTGEVMRGNLEEGETKIFFIPLRGQSTETVYDACVAKACMMGECVTQAFTCKVDPLCECEAGRQYCDDDIIYQCTENCEGFDPIEDCKAKGQRCLPNMIGGTFYCADKVVPPLTCETDCYNKAGTIPYLNIDNPFVLYPCLANCWWETYQYSVLIIAGLLVIIGGFILIRR